MRTADKKGGWEHGGRGFRAGRSEFSAARTAESRSVGKGTVARARDRNVYGSHVCGSRSFEVNDPAWGQFRSSLGGRGTPRSSEKTSLASRTQRTLGASTPVHGRSRRLRSRGRSPHSKEGHENLIGPEELPDGEARLSALDWLREWQEGVEIVRESGRLYDEEAARASSAGPFVLPVARGSTEGAEVGQRLTVLESQNLRDPEGGDQRGVRMTTSEAEGWPFQRCRHLLCPAQRRMSSSRAARL